MVDLDLYFIKQSSDIEGFGIGAEWLQNLSSRFGQFCLQLKKKKSRGGWKGDGEEERRGKKQRKKGKQ